MWGLSSRIHPLNHFPADGLSCYVKRDDELSCGISGTKIRKYASLIPFFIKNHMEHLIIIAGPQSNNLLSALQVARELKLSVSVFLLKPKTTAIQGNFKLSLLFLNEDELIWIPREDWHRVNNLAFEYLTGLNKKGFILEEGASVPEALDGAMSLAEDILRNEQELGQTFEHIFIDAGTGFSAAALIYGLEKARHKAMVHVLLLADDKTVFQEKLKHWIGYNPNNYTCFYPKTARSFGSLNQSIKNEIKRMAYEEGILTDPIYSAKLFHETRRYVVEEGVRGRVLIIHSGGALTLSGFELPGAKI